MRNNIIEKVRSRFKGFPYIAIGVVPKKNNNISVFVNMHLANKAVIRKLCPIPTVDEFLHDLNQPKIFSKLYIKWAYHQMELFSTSEDIKISWPL